MKQIKFSIVFDGLIPCVVNILDISAIEITKIYKQRWSIERFFRMINRTTDAAKLKF